MIEQSPPLTGYSVTRETVSIPRLSGQWLRVGRVGWVLLGLAALAVLITSLPGYAREFGGVGHVEIREPTTSIIVFSALSGAASLASALLSLILSWTFFWRRFEEPAAAALAFYLLVYAVVMAGPLERWSVYWTGDTTLAESLQAILLATPTVALLLLFPSGRFVPGWTRWVFLLTIPWNVSLFFLPGFDGASLLELSPVSLALLTLWYVSFLGIGLYAQVYRFRRVASAVERKQIKWVVSGFALWMIFIAISTGPYLYLSNLPAGAPIPWWAGASSLGWNLALNIIPVSLTIAVTRHRLWDIDLVINRALVYGALTVSVVGIYALVVGAVGALLQAQGNWLVAFLATALVAVLFHPLRERLQQWVNRLVYGQRDEPFEVIARLGQRLEGTLSPEMVYPTIVETVAQTLKLPYVAIAVGDGDSFETIESYGKPAGKHNQYPLLYQNELVGQLMVDWRSPSESFTEADERLLRSIARQAGAAVHAVQLTADLQHSRQRLVTTREEERRRLRRDLHDGLGPTLASHMLKIGSVRALLKHDPAAADDLLEDMESDIETTLAAIRQLVYDLRPPALDQLGLLGAVEEFAAGYDAQLGDLNQGSERGSLSITVHATGLPHALPAAVEVAAYRIVQEGLTNVARHARATCCSVVLDVVEGPEKGKQHLHIEIHDDGIGLPEELRAGVGLMSMRERAEEVGGTFTIESSAGQGTWLVARLPVLAEPDRVTESAKDKRWKRSSAS